MSEETELFAAVTKIDLVDAIKHIRDRRCYIDNHNRQKYADLIEGQAKLIAHLLNDRRKNSAEAITIVRALRATYSTHPIIMEAADALERNGPSFTPANEVVGCPRIP